MPDDGRTYYVFRQLEHPREKKHPKALYAIFQFFGARDIRKDPTAGLRRYHQVFAADTNSKEGVAATGVVRLSPSLEVQAFKSWKFPPETEKPEREGGAEFLRRRDPAPDRRRCLVVDSDLGALTRINHREEPIVEGFFLPDGWQLHYASDKAADFVLNKVITACDRDATAELRRKK